MNGRLQINRKDTKESPSHSRQNRPLILVIILIINCIIIKNCLAFYGYAATGTIIYCGIIKPRDAPFMFVFASIGGCNTVHQGMMPRCLLIGCGNHWSIFKLRDYVILGLS